ncbi:deoxyhypusine hydroxylase-like [Liolophura sinensis]|uniref:deoxyhypusine hydroxylase-like n=1 Tax=Liolophura sinensis TaxID=3198878 RepID=UPI0031594D94
MTTEISSDSVEKIGQQLLDTTKPLNDRFRALFTLRNLGGEMAIDFISRCFTDPSALLKHELAYCLGQMQDVYAIPTLKKVLQDESQEAMVRHEAGEALGAIGSPESLEILKQYSNDSVKEVAETCQLAVNRINWLLNDGKNQVLNNRVYLSVDPAPPDNEVNVDVMRNTLLNENLSLFERYRAMFSLRNTGGKDAVLALAEGLKCSSALFRHEVAYVLGQMQHDACVQQLAVSLKDKSENPMVRHECAEALGSIATKECTDILQKYLTDEERVVRESCVVALDISEHEKSEHFQYADTLSKLTDKKQVNADELP